MFTSFVMSESEARLLGVAFTQLLVGEKMSTSKIDRFTIDDRDRETD